MENLSKNEDSEDVVKASQELNGSSSFKENEKDDFNSKLEMIFSLYKKHCGERCRLPETSKCPMRDEKRLRDQRLESLVQIRALCHRFEGMVAAEQIAGKYLSFDDVAQRDALDIMCIRYEELSDDIFAPNDAFMSLFDADYDQRCYPVEERKLPKLSSNCDDTGADYAELCIQSMLTEVGLCYVNKIDTLVKSMATQAAEYHNLISLQVNTMNSIALDNSKAREESGDLAATLEKVVGVVATRILEKSEEERNL
ncbi:unnamed protein product [Haemonchus placei]|uniref:Uncharacterized protein n=1 Tax=Haemonchus placei TaxID=6290 RepID=A0A0N4W2H2_HAEPC|nr:unnamed protein product [Haemonchus placei]